jgi:hypothetical protein
VEGSGGGARGRAGGRPGGTICDLLPTRQETYPGGGLPGRRPTREKAYLPGRRPVPRDSPSPSAPAAAPTAAPSGRELPSCSHCVIGCVISTLCKSNYLFGYGLLQALYPATRVRRTREKERCQELARRVSLEVLRSRSVELLLAAAAAQDVLRSSYLEQSSAKLLCTTLRYYYGLQSYVPILFKKSFVST